MVSFILRKTESQKLAEEVPTKEEYEAAIKEEIKLTQKPNIYTYNKADSLINNMYVQSYYEMAVDNKDKISKKEESIKYLASTVSGFNSNPGHINVLGFNAMNANTGSATGLVTYAFAHEFNGYAFEFYLDYMKHMEDNGTPLRSGIVAMDHYGARIFDDNEKIKVYGDKLSWAVIESNFYNGQ